VNAALIERPSALSADLDRVLDLARDDLAALSGCRLLLTGGTGFVGRWLLETLVLADERLGLGLDVVTVVRDPRRLPAHLALARPVDVHTADVRGLCPVGAVDAVVSGAASSSAAFGVGDGDPAVLADTIVSGTRAALAAATGNRPRFLLLSSGAVYGPQPQQLPRIAETFPGAPDPLDPRGAYGTAKRAAESLVGVATAAGEVDGVVARIFTLLGPLQPLDGHFAVGNLLADALAGRPVTLTGDGRPVRTYLHATDLTVALLALLVRGRSGAAYNVGSDAPVTLAELAGEIADLPSPRLPVRLGSATGPAGAGARYVPDTSRIRTELRLPDALPRRAALVRTFDWWRSR
jgi:dTDP-glucose 4,6-dehydratase